MRIAVIEDEEFWRRKIRDTVANFWKKDEAMLCCYESGESFLSASLQFDILLMDLELQGKDGFTIAEKYRQWYPEALLVILTTHTELSRRGYLVEAFRFIDKMHMNEELPEALCSAAEKLQQMRLISLHVVHLGKLHVRVKDILYMETECRNTKVVTAEKSYICTDTITDFEQLLERDGFYRCHKSYLVNLGAIKEFNHLDVVFGNGAKAMVSNRKYSQLRKKYLEYRFSHANA